MKKATSIVLALLLVVSLAGCGSSSDNVKPADKPAESVEPSAEAAVDGSGTLGDYSVTIKGIALTTDYEGKPAVVVTYSWTNNSDETANFAFALSTQVFQNDIECEMAIIMDSDAYSADNYMKDIKPGASLDVQLAYVLQDSTNPIDVEVSDIFGLSDKMVTQNYNIA